MNEQFDHSRFDEIFGDFGGNDDDFNSFNAVEYEANQRKHNLVHEIVTIEGDDHTSGYSYRKYPRTRMEMLALWAKVS